MIRVIFFVVLALIPGSIAAQNEPRTGGIDTGFYELVVHKEEKQKPETVVVFLRRTGTSVELHNLGTDEKLRSEIFENRMSGIATSGKVETVAFETNRKDKSLPSYLLFGASRNQLFVVGLQKNEQFEVTVTALPSVWACGNHDKPTHTAKTEPEIKHLIAQHGCSLWHKLKESDMR